MEIRQGKPVLTLEGSGKWAEIQVEGAQAYQQAVSAQTQVCITHRRAAHTHTHGHTHSRPPLTLPLEDGMSIILVGLECCTKA